MRKKRELFVPIARLDGVIRFFSLCSLTLISIDITRVKIFLLCSVHMMIVKLLASIRYYTIYIHGRYLPGNCATASFTAFARSKSSGDSIPDKDIEI